MSSYYFNIIYSFYFFFSVFSRNLILIWLKFSNILT